MPSTPAFSISLNARSNVNTSGASGQVGHIAIGATRDAGALVLSVEDDGAGFDADPFAVAGVGLSATRDRLALRYGTAGSIRCEARSAGARGARVAIRIPLDGARSV